VLTGVVIHLRGTATTATPFSWARRLSESSACWPVPSLPGSRRSSLAAAADPPDYGELPALLPDPDDVSPMKEGEEEGQLPGHGSRAEARAGVGPGAGFHPERYGVDGWEGGLPLELDRRPKPSGWLVFDPVFGVVPQETLELWGRDPCGRGEGAGGISTVHDMAGVRGEKGDAGGGREGETGRRVGDDPLGQMTHDPSSRPHREKQALPPVRGTLEAEQWLGSRKSQATPHEGKATTMPPPPPLPPLPNERHGGCPSPSSLLSSSPLTEGSSDDIMVPPTRSGMPTNRTGVSGGAGAGAAIATEPAVVFSPRTCNGKGGGGVLAEGNVGTGGGGDEAGTGAVAAAGIVAGGHCSKTPSVMRENELKSSTATATATAAKSPCSAAGGCPGSEREEGGLFRRQGGLSGEAGSCGAGLMVHGV
ncbi:unnamed protein product, partial [Discosporangium mesarthrocarpum]